MIDIKEIDDLAKNGKGLNMYGSMKKFLSHYEEHKKEQIQKICEDLELER